MKLNYIMLPENYHPRPGHRDRVKVSQTCSPMSRAGRRVQGEAKVTVTMAGNAKEEDRATEFTKFVKTLNRKVAGQRRAAPPARRVVEVDFAPRPTRLSDRVQRLTAWLARSADAANAGSRLSSKRGAAKSAMEPIWRRAVNRVKVKIAMSSTMRPADMPRPHNPVNQIPVVANRHQTLVGPTDVRFVNDGIIHRQFPSVAVIQNQVPLNQHHIYGAITPGLSHNVMAHQDVLFPGPDIHNHDYLELERTAVACAYMGMDEPMDTSPDFPSLLANDDYRNLERTAIECAYAAMDEPMDTTLDDTQGPMAYVVHQNVPPVIDFVGNPQEGQFDHGFMFQQQVYETLRPPGHQDFVDQDYRLWPPAYAHIDNQIPPQPRQEHFVNGNLPLRHYYQDGQYPQGEEYLGFLPEFERNAPVHPVAHQVLYEQDVLGMAPVQQQADIHHQPIVHAVHFHPGVQEQRIDQGPVQHVNGLILAHDLGGWQHAEGERQYDDTGFFVDVLGGNLVEQEAPNRRTDEAHILDRIEVHYGEEDDNDDDDDDYGDTDDDDDYDNEEENELHVIF